jgi:tetratricopeptide (TPR) repeat protein
VRPSLSVRFALYFLLAIAVCIATPAQSTPSASAAPHNGHLVLVMPFENLTAQTSLDWISESVPEVLNQRFASAGYLPINRSDRLYALDHLGLPLSFRPSRASTIRLAQTLDADYVIYGSYSLQGNTLKISAHILDVGALKTGPEIVHEAELPHLLDMLNSLAWRIVRRLDPTYSVAEQTFVAANANVRLDAFENYIRGLVEDQDSERIRHLKESVRLSPDFYAAWLALGRAYFAHQDYELAASTLGKLPKTDSHALEAQFYRGLALFYIGSYVKAEDAFAFVATMLPLPEVVNNQGVAASRHGRDGSPQFQQAIAVDPKDPDYHFNLAVSLRKKNNTAGAAHEIDLALKLKPNDSELQAFAALLKNGPPKAPTVKPYPGAPEPDPPSEPMERVKRGYNEASFRQAAFELEQVEAMQLAALPPSERAQAHVKQGNVYLNRGFILEAERQFQDAVQADPNSASAHAGLAEVRERTGEPEAARQEAQKSIALKPNVLAYLVLGRLNLAANKLPESAANVNDALKLEPSNANALGLAQALQSRGQKLP